MGWLTGGIAALMRLPEEERIFKNMSRQDITVMKWEKETIPKNHGMESSGLLNLHQPGLPCFYR